MIINRINGATRVLGAPPGRENEVIGLPVLDVQSDIGPAMVSSWEPTPAELALLNTGQPVQLWVYGAGHPVVSLTVGIEFNLPESE